jgi:tetratricopeptide (TPR) repeat protein
MVRMLAETGELVGEPGSYSAPAHIATLQVPPNVKPVIAARIDRLDPADRRVLQIAAVIGKDIPRPVLKALCGLKREDLNAAIRRLAKVEFLFELQSYPEIEYTFKHALTHDVAYESLVGEDRKRIHADVLALMERLYDGQLTPQAERLAHHAMMAEAWGAASKYLLQATDRALDVSAYHKAARFLDQAARAIDTQEDTAERRAQAIDIRTRMRPALEGVDRFATAIERLDEAEALAEGLGDATRLQQVLLHKSYAYSTHGRLDLAIEAADRLRGIARKAGDARFAAEADLAAAQGMIFRHNAREVMARLEPHEAQFTGPWRMDRFGLLGTRSVFFLGYLSMSAALLGDLKRAWSVAEAMNVAVQESGRPIDRYAGAYQEASVNILAGPDERFERKLAAMAEECRVRAPSPFYPMLLSRLGHVRVLRGRPEDACETLDEALQRAERSDMPHVRLYAQALHAIAECQVNGPAALGGLRAALKTARAQSDRWIEVLVLRAIADVSPPVAALADLERAEAIAVAQGYRPEQAKICVARGEIAELHDADLSRRAYEQARALFAEIGLQGRLPVLAADTVAGPRP